MVLICFLSVYPKMQGIYNVRMNRYLVLTRAVNDDDSLYQSVLCLFRLSANGSASEASFSITSSITTTLPCRVSTGVSTGETVPRRSVTQFTFCRHANSLCNLTKTIKWIPLNDPNTCVIT